MHFCLPCIYCRTRLRPYVFHITFLVLFGVFNIHIQVSRSDCGLEEAITVGNSNLTSHEHFGNAKRISEP